jgi:hypothetical protein
MKAKKGTKKKRTSKKHKNPLRIERPTGLTITMRKYHNTKDIRYLKISQENIMNQYIQEGMSLNGTPYSIEQLSAYTGVQKKEILQKLTKSTQEILGIKDKEGTDEVYRAIFGMALNMALGDRHLALKQYSTMLASQGNGYKAFVSGTVNDSLRQVMASSRMMLDLAKALKAPGANQTTVQINNNQQNNATPGVPEQRAIGPNEAVMIISEQMKGLSIMSDDSALKALEAEYVTGADLPQVIATKQHGTDFILGTDTHKPTTRKKQTSALIQDIEPIK